MRLAAALAAVLLTLGFGARAGAEPAAELPLDRAIEVALADNPQAAIAREQIRAARYRVKSAKALRLPSLNLEGNIIFWDQRIDFLAGDPSMLPPGADATITVRERITATGTVTAAQPLSGLLVVGRLIRLEEAGADVALAENSATRLELAYRVAAAYLEALQAEASRAIAEVAVRQVEAQLERARALSEAGVLERVDVMRLEAALAGVRQQLLQANTGAILAKDALALAMGLSPGSEVTPRDDFPAQPGPPPWDASALVEAAQQARPELAAARHRVDQAYYGRELAKADLLPNILGVATYQRNEGGGVFQPKNTWYLGVTLEWNVWDWGREWYQVQEAGAQVRQATLGAELLQDQVALQAKGAALQARAAYDALAVVTAGLEAAEEAYRIQTVRFGEGEATTTDLLDAETEVSQARLRYSTARYAYLLALAAAARAAGELPQAVLDASTPRGNR